MPCPMGQRGLCFRVAEVGAGRWGQPAAWAPFAEPNKGAFFRRGLGGSTARLETKPPASEADGGRTGGSSRGQEKRRRRRGCTRAPGELPPGALRGQDLGTLMSPSPGCPSGRRVLGAWGRGMANCPHPMMPPRRQRCCHSTPQAKQPPTLQNIFFFFFLALKGTKTPHGKARAGTQADVQAKSERPGTAPILAGRCRWQVPAAGSSPPCQVQPKPAHESKLRDPPEHK